MTGGGRRHAARSKARAGDVGLRARLRTGHELAVIDVSVDGILLEGPARLLPGRNIDLLLAGRDRRTSVRARVVHSRVAAVNGSGVLYRAGLAFDRRLDEDDVVVGGPG